MRTAQVVAVLEDKQVLLVQVQFTTLLQLRVLARTTLKELVCQLFEQIGHGCGGRQRVMRGRWRLLRTLLPRRSVGALPDFAESRCFGA